MIEFLAAQLKGEDGFEVKSEVSRVRTECKQQGTTMMVSVGWVRWRVARGGVGGA